MDPESAKHNLAVTLSILRRCLEPGLQRGSPSAFIEYQRRLCRIKGDAPVWLDVREFDRLISQGRRSSQQGRFAEGCPPAPHAFSGPERFASEAIKQYNTCLRILHEELGICPSGETVALARAIMAGEDV